jgi:anti-sigma regulatory factor (Ser/Thr protein kinase)
MNGRTGTVSGSAGNPGPAVPQEHGSGAGSAPIWPRASLLRLGALPTAVGCGREHTRLVLMEWGLGHLVSDAVLIASELLTNALQASLALGNSTPIALRLLASDEQLIIEAWDQWVVGYDLNRMPGDDEHGRGLAVIDALSNRWGTGRLSTDYKVVWAELLI